MRIFLSLAAVVFAGAIFLVDAISDAAAHAPARTPVPAEHLQP